MNEENKLKLLLEFEPYDRYGTKFIVNYTRSFNMVYAGNGFICSGTTINKINSSLK